MDQASGFRLVLRGQRLTYSIEDFIYGAERTASNWTFGYCRRAEINAPQANQTIKQITLSAQVVKLLSPVEARSKMSRVRGRIGSWESLRVQLEPAPEQISAERNLHKSLALGQMLEYVFAAADVFPIEILKSQASTAQSEDGRERLVVRARADAERESLSKALALTTPAARLGEALSSDLVETTDRVPTWKLTDSPTLGERSDVSTEWQYEGTELGADGGQTFLFVGDFSTPLIANAYLVSDEAVGRDSQFKRRMKSFRVLGEHAELSRMLIDPRAKVFRHEDGFEPDSHLVHLDESKQKAFNAAVQTIPLFLIQGPPGVGKTRLVRELVRRTLAEDSSTRILLSAQSNSSLDHLLQEIEVIFNDVADGPLMVRCKPKEKEEEASQFNISHQTKQLLRKLSTSALYMDAPAALRRRVDSLREAYGEDFQSSDSRAVPEATVSSRKALEGLVLRSANLVFATANSADLERLIEEKSQFDWTIIEEAAKATGGELVSPLLLSHRRLMIGDHKQLPPFNAERFLRLLEAPKAVRKALQVAEPMIGPTFRDATIEEVFTEADGEGDVESDAAFASLCSEAVRNFSLFETLIEDEFDRQKRAGSGKPIAMSLTNQHRMHPAIAEVVSRTFYEELGLSTDKNRSEFYRSSPSPVVSVDTNRLPDCPFVWIDMPWVQNTMNMKEGERRPAFTNADELEAVRKVLYLLRARQKISEMPSLAILSPYLRQVSRLRLLIDERQPCAMKHLNYFAPGSKQKAYCATVDSFQGSEADCVVISLVRNNGHTGIRSALGFLSDARRMNVLLSRAKWRMVVIGSLDFLDSINLSPKPVEDTERIRFLNRLLAAVRSPTFANEISIVPFAKLQGAES